MENLLTFIAEHADDDVTRLLLDRKKYPGIDMDLAVNSIESRRKLKGKVNEWYSNSNLIFPLKLSAEQCSSSATGRYKAALADKIVRSTSGKDIWSLTDLTGGLGIDSWFFSQKASHVTYNEMQKALCEAACHNFKSLDIKNIDIINSTVTADSDIEMLCKCPSGYVDIVYLDPARRSETGKKVFLIEDCSPDVLTLKDEIFKYCRYILIKLSPMADITMACSRLGQHCREVHIVSTGGECKELLIWMDRAWSEEFSIHAVELNKDNLCEGFSFKLSEEKEATSKLSTDLNFRYIFEPGKSLMKAGAFNLIAEKFGLEKLGRSTHYYTTDSSTTVESLKVYGKVYSVMECLKLDKRNLNQVGAKYPKAEVTARNIPMDTDTLRKKLGATSGDDAHIFGLKSDLLGNLLIVGRREF